MIRQTLLLLLLSILTIQANAQQDWTDRTRLLPERLRGIPSGIALEHTPTPVYPETNTDTVNYPGKFIWKHSTKAQTLLDQLTVVAAGSYIWMGDKGWITNIQLDNQGFAERFKCPKGILQIGKSYEFSKNWRFGDQVYAGDALWFVLAKDRNGKLYKGIAVVETEGFALRPDELDVLTGKHWTGTLTYLDYGSGELTTIPTELTVKNKGQGVYEWGTAYPKEPGHNSTDELTISSDGKVLDGENVTERMLTGNFLKIVTEKTGTDNHKAARFGFTYLIGKNAFSRKKEVRYDVQENWFMRNELKLAAK